MGKRLIVGMKDADASLEALRWALTVAEREDAQLVVVHAASIPIAVRNGPSRAAAFQMGDPLWATIHSTVSGFAPPAGTVTVVEGGRAVDVIAKHARQGDTIVLGPPSKRWLSRRGTGAQLRALGHDVRVIEAVSSNPVGASSIDSVPIVHAGESSQDGQHRGMASSSA